MVLIIPTCVPKSLEDLQGALDEVGLFSQYIHLDIDDGDFTPALSWPYERVGELGAVTLSHIEGMEIGVHLMVRDVEHAGEVFAKAGAHTVIGHVEAFADIEDAPRALESWRTAGANEVGLAILLDTDIELLEVAINSCDLLHVLSVRDIGEQGAPFDEHAIARVKKLRALYPHTTISVDGGVNEKNIAKLVHSGASQFSVGSAIMHSAHPAHAYAHLKVTAESALQ